MFLHVYSINSLLELDFFETYSLTHNKVIHKPTKSYVIIFQISDLNFVAGSDG